MLHKVERLWAAVDKRAFSFLVLLSVVCIFFSVLIPPFQSPDEFDHIKRAYLLSKGQFILDRPAGQSSGGKIDTGLAAFMAMYKPYVSMPHNKMTADVANRARAIQWSGQVEFSPAPGTGYYFPLIYLPQSIGLAVGERLGMSVEASYRLARIAALAAALVLALLAFGMHPANPLVWGLLALPMSVFQLSSASLDGVSTSLAILTIAMFLRTWEEPRPGRWAFYCLAICVVVLATSRIHLLPLWLLLPFAASNVPQRKAALSVCALSLVFITVWLLVAIGTTSDMRPERAGIDVPPSDIIVHYLRHPLSFFDVLWNTISAKDTLVGYGYSFFGILGWLDTRFSLEQYVFLCGCIGCIALLTISTQNLLLGWRPRALLILVAVLSLLLIFFALLVTWTAHPAQTVRGVQGRYFLVPAIIVGYALAGGIPPWTSVFRKIGLGLVAVLFAFDVFNMTWLLVSRYYLTAQAASEHASLGVLPF